MIITAQKKPIQVDACQLQADPGTQGHIVDWMRDSGCPCRPWWDESYCIDIQTLEGTMRAHPGDWIIRGVTGEFYPCKPDVFEKTYDIVDTQ